MKQIPPLTDDEFQALAGLMDAGVRATGLQSVKSAAALMVKLEASEEAAEPEAKKEPENANE